MSCYTTPYLGDTVGAAAQTFAAALQYFAAAQCLIGDSPIPNSDVNNYDSFDFIVIGGGTAGSVVANRLSEVADWNILLIEAGSDQPIESSIPGLQPTLFGSEYDWKYLTVDNGTVDQAIINGTGYFIRGKMLGGCSSINNMIYIQGNDNDYQSWYDAGNKEWSVSQIRKFFKKAESLQSMDLLNDSAIYEHYGHDGPLIINKLNNTYSDYTKRVIESWVEIGMKKVSDVNVANVMGCSTVVVTSANGVRQSTKTAYLTPVKDRKNLKILKNAFVSNILINENFTAYGVKVEWAGEDMTFYSSKEVILSAGTFNSPQLLMLSGVGPKDHLESKNITCLVDSPMVGQNFQEHSVVPITIYGNLPEATTTSETYLEIIEYLGNRSGYLAQTAIKDVTAFYSTIENATVPNCQNHLTIVEKNSTSTLKNSYTTIFRYNKTVLDSIVKLNNDYTLYNILFVHLHPYSRGNISLSSNNPTDAPLIYPKYFDDIRDLDTVVAGIKMATKIVNTTFFRSIGGFLGRMDVPQCNDFELDSECYWKCISMNLVTSLYHPVGTCQMGPVLDKAVVNSRLKVHGVLNLRVIDASVMPTTISGNTAAATIMIGERGSELIKEDYNVCE